MAERFSPRFVYALAEVITGTSSSSSDRQVGIYRTGREIEKFFMGLGYHKDWGGKSRLHFTEDLLMEIYHRAGGFERIREIAEEAVDPGYYIGHEDELQNVLRYLNEHLQPDGFLLKMVDERYKITSRQDSPQYQVALSYASEDRTYVRAVAGFLEDNQITFFYDEFEEARLWGKDLYEYFDAIFRKASRYCVMFISEHYARKVWPTHERRSAFARALQEKDEEYVLPVRFDDTKIPGLSPTVGYIDLRKKTAEELGKLILKKLG